MDTERVTAQAMARVTIPDMEKGIPDQDMEEPDMAVTGVDTRAAVVKETLEVEVEIQMIIPLLYSGAALELIRGNCDLF